MNQRHFNIDPQHTVFGPRFGLTSGSVLGGLQLVEEREMSLASMICDAAREIVEEQATKGSDGFRQWVYPNLPANYHMNADVEAEIEIEMAKGKSAAEIGRILYERHN